MGDKCILFVKEPTPAELSANGGRLLVTLALREMANDDYQGYLQTNHWKQVRARAFQTYGRRCTIGIECSGPPNVHHRSYESLGDELMEHVEVLCEKHHIEKHENDRRRIHAELERQLRDYSDQGPEPEFFL